MKKKITKNKSRLVTIDYLDKRVEEVYSRLDDQTTILTGYIDLRIQETKNEFKDEMQLMRDEMRLGNELLRADFRDVFLGKNAQYDDTLRSHGTRIKRLEKHVGISI